MLRKGKGREGGCARKSQSFFFSKIDGHDQLGFSSIMGVAVQSSY